jgi:general secretion pathway protein D
MPVANRPVLRQRPLALLFASSLLAAGCAANPMHLGRQAELVSDYDKAVVEYTRALRQHPDDVDARKALDRAKVRAATEHLTRGRRLVATNKMDQAVVELELAGELNPSSQEIQDELRRARIALRNKIPAPPDGKTALQSLIDRTRDMQPAGYELPHDVKLPASLVFREASSRDVITTLARVTGLNVVFDPAFREVPVTTELRDVSLEDALGSITASTHTFYKVTAPRTITIVPDTPAKRREYEDEVVRTFYLSNADLKETIDLLRIVVDLRRIAGVPGANALTIKDTPDRLSAAARIITAIDKARPECVIDVELLEVDRSRLKEYGLQVASPGQPGINGSADVNRQNLTLESLRNLTAADVFLSGVPALYYRLLRSDNNTRVLANPQLRTAEGVAAQARFGDEVPVPVTTFAPIATGGVAQQPVTSFNYRNIGVNIDITPRIHHDDDVSLALKVEISSLSGTGFGGLPTFGNRSINTEIRLRDGETNMLAGLIRDDEREIKEGVPGLSDLPVVGQIFGRNHKEATETDIILTLTPHIVRVLDLHEADLAPFRLGREGTTTTILEMPGAPVAPAQPQPQPEQPPAQPPGRPVLPILPPEPTPPQPTQPTPPTPPTNPQ